MQLFWILLRLLLGVLGGWVLYIFSLPVSGETYCAIVTFFLMCVAPTIVEWKKSKDTAESVIKFYVRYLFFILWVIIGAFQSTPEILFFGKIFLQIIACIGFIWPGTIFAPVEKLINHKSQPATGRREGSAE